MDDVKLVGAYFELADILKSRACSIRSRGSFCSIQLHNCGRGNENTGRIGYRCLSLATEIQLGHFFIVQQRVGFVLESHGSLIEDVASIGDS